MATRGAGKLFPWLVGKIAVSIGGLRTVGKPCLWAFVPGNPGISLGSECCRGAGCAGKKMARIPALNHLKLGFHSLGKSISIYGYVEIIFRRGLCCQSQTGPCLTQFSP